MVSPTFMARISLLLVWVAVGAEATCKPYRGSNIKCLAGFYCTPYGYNDRRSSCVRCPKGHWCPGGESAEGERIFACKSGESSPSIGAEEESTCKECESGKYSSAPGAGTCNDCESGKYYDGKGARSASMCRDCESGKYYSGTGASSASM